jgi:hypothetical protein
MSFNLLSEKARKSLANNYFYVYGPIRADPLF